MKILVTYFSAEFGVTKALAEKLASVVNADLFEIKPVIPYSKADVRYTNPLARCNREKLAKKEVQVSGYPENFEQYDMVLIGFPIWYGCAPNVVNSFCKNLDFTGKKVAAFATSGGSGIGKTAVKLEPYINGAKVMDAKLFNGTDEERIAGWVNTLCN